MKRKISDVIGIICGLFILWFIASVIDIDINNIHGEGYAPWNLIVWFFEGV